MTGLKKFQRSMFLTERCLENFAQGSPNRKWRVKHSDADDDYQMTTVERDDRRSV
jgi:hypothetical protein